MALAALLQPSQAAGVCRVCRCRAAECFAPAKRLGEVAAHMLVVLRERFRSVQRTGVGERLPDRQGEAPIAACAMQVGKLQQGAIIHRGLCRHLRKSDRNRISNAVN